MPSADDLAAKLAAAEARVAALESRVGGGGGEAEKLQKLEYQVLHLTRALKAADASLDAALAPGADLAALREKRWDAAPVGG